MPSFDVFGMLETDVENVCLPIKFTPIEASGEQEAIEIAWQSVEHQIPGPVNKDEWRALVSQEQETSETKKCGCGNRPLSPEFTKILADALEGLQPSYSPVVNE